MVLREKLCLFAQRYKDTNSYLDNIGSKIRKDIIFLTTPSIKPLHYFPRVLSDFELHKVFRLWSTTIKMGFVFLMINSDQITIGKTHLTLVFRMGPLKITDKRLKSWHKKAWNTWLLFRKIKFCQNTYFCSDWKFLPKFLFFCFIFNISGISIWPIWYSFTSNNLNYPFITLKNL